MKPDELPGPVLDAVPPPGPSPAVDDPLRRADGELRPVELIYRVGLIIGATLFLYEGQGAPWERGWLATGAAVSLSALVVVTLAFTWRVMGDWRRWSNQIVYVALIAALAIPLGAALDPTIGGSALPAPVELALDQLLSSLGKVPGVGAALAVLRGIIVFAMYAVVLVVLLAASGPAQRGGFAFLCAMIGVLGVFFHPSAETIVGFALLAFAIKVQWERALLIPDKLRPHLAPAQLDFLRELVRNGSLSAGETRLYLDGNPAYLHALLEFGLVDYESMTREVVPGRRLLHDPAAEALEFGLSIMRRGAWIAVGVAYFLLPDLIPGPLDDIVVMMVCAGAGFGWISQLFGSRRAVR